MPYLTRRAFSAYRSKTSITARRWHLCALDCIVRSVSLVGLAVFVFGAYPTLESWHAGSHILSRYQHARPSSIVNRASGKIDGRHGRLFVPAGESTFSRAQWGREGKARSNADAFGLARSIDDCRCICTAVRWLDSMHVRWCRSESAWRCRSQLPAPKPRSALVPTVNESRRLPCIRCIRVCRSQ